MKKNNCYICKYELTCYDFIFIKLDVNLYTKIIFINNYIVVTLMIN